MTISNGLYKVEFTTPLGTGIGAIVLNNGTIKGGDSALYYVGTYEETGNQFTANIKTARHTTNPNIVSVFGKDNVNISVKGTATENSAELQGSAPEAPGVTFQAKLTKLTD